MGASAVGGGTKLSWPFVRMSPPWSPPDPIWAKGPSFHRFTVTLKRLSMTNRPNAGIR